MTNHHLSQAAVGELDRPIDLSGHVLPPFFIRNMDYMDSRFHSISHLMCYRYAIANDQRTFGTGIRKWSKHLVDFPTTKFVTSNKIRQWREILIDIYSHLCMMNESLKASFRQLQLTPDLSLSDNSARSHGDMYPLLLTPVHYITPLRALMSSVTFSFKFVQTPESNTLTVNRWLGMPESRRGTRRAAISLAERI